jgi:hypothetical protein
MPLRLQIRSWQQAWRVHCEIFAFRGKADIDVKGPYFCF